MRLMHVVDSLEFGGLERVVTDLAIEQKRRGHAVSVFSINATEGLAAQLRDAGIEIIVGGKQGTFDVKVLRRLRSAARGLDLVHAHNFVPNYYAATALLGLRRAPVLVGTSHDMGTRLSRASLRFMYRCSLWRTAGVAMVGQQVHDRFVSAGWVSAQRATTVLNGIPVDRFRTSPERRLAARQALGLKADELVLGAVGRLVPLKNHRLLIDVLPRLLKQHPALKLVLIGAGPLDAELRSHAASLGVAPQVLFAGQRSDVADLTAAFDVFAMPSLTEGLSIALLEACAASLAIVATAVGGNGEIIEHGQRGLLVPAGDGPALEAALGVLLADEPQRRRLGQAACDWVCAHASIEALGSAYDTFYERALS